MKNGVAGGVVEAIEKIRREVEMLSEVVEELLAAMQDVQAMPRRAAAARS